MGVFEWFVDTMARTETLDLYFDPELENILYDGEEYDAWCDEEYPRSDKPIGLQVW